MMLDEPRNELRVGQEQSEQTEGEIEISKLHSFDFLATFINLSSKSGWIPVAATIESMTTLHVHVVPNAKINKVVGEHGGAIKIKLRAPAAEGKANSALISFLTDELNVSQRAIVLQHGQKSRHKVIRIVGLTEEEVRRRLRAKS